MISTSNNHNLYSKNKQFHVCLFIFVIIFQHQRFADLSNDNGPQEGAIDLCQSFFSNPHQPHCLDLKVTSLSLLYYPSWKYFIRKD